MINIQYIAEQYSLRMAAAQREKEPLPSLENHSIIAQKRPAKRLGSWKPGDLTAYHFELESK